MAHFDTIIANGTLIDGTRSPRRRTDVGITGGVVAAVGDLGSDTAELTIDATGATVAPGFIDLHTHYDAQLFWDPYLAGTVLPPRSSETAVSDSLPSHPIFANEPCSRWFARKRSPLMPCVSDSRGTG
jgi:cytosine/adenosine deaminase-related metal-dependent hydrolase